MLQHAGARNNASSSPCPTIPPPPPPFLQGQLTTPRLWKACPPPASFTHCPITNLVLAAEEGSLIMTHTDRAAPGTMPRANGAACLSAGLVCLHP